MIGGRAASPARGHRPPPAPPARGAGLGGAYARSPSPVILVTSGGGSRAPPPLPLPGIGQPAKPGDPFAYVASRESDFVARAIAGSAHVLYVKSPGGVLATAAPGGRRSDR